MNISFKQFLNEESIPVTGTTVTPNGKLIPYVFCPVGTKKYKKSNGDWACKLISKLKKKRRNKK